MGDLTQYGWVLLQELINAEFEGGLPSLKASEKRTDNKMDEDKTATKIAKIMGRIYNKIDRKLIIHKKAGFLSLVAIKQRTPSLKLLDLVDRPHSDVQCQQTY